MNREELKIKLLELYPGLTMDESGEWLVANVEASQWPALSKDLKFHEGLAFDYLFCVTCVDWKTHLSMVYHLTSTIHQQILVVKCKLDRTKPEIESVAHIWRTAEFHEREQYEMFGVNFLNHPDLRLLILPDGWEGKFPMRKDYEDPVNMIKL